MPNLSKVGWERNMQKILVTGLLIGSVFLSPSYAQVANDADGLYDSTTLVDTNNNSTSTSTVNSTSTNTNTNNNVNTTTVDSTNTNNNINTSTSTSTNVNTNNNINSGEQTFNNNNVNTSTSTSTNTNNNNNVSTSTSNNTNTNINTSTSTSTNTNNNNNVNTSTSTSTNTNNNNNVNTSTSTSTNTNNNNNVNSSTSTSTSNNVNTNNNTNSTTSSNNNINQNINSGTMTNNNNNKIDQTIKSPPPSAIAPAMMSGGNSDLCTTGTSGAVQTQILGVSSGGTIRDLNCERLKNAKVLYDMGMKVAAVATLCQDRRVFDAMWHAGTPCPFDGMIGEQARKAWAAFPDRIPKPEDPPSDDFYKKTGFGALLGLLLFGLL